MAPLRSGRRRESDCSWRRTAEKRTDVTKVELLLESARVGRRNLA
ncbi:hypothetical protein HSB1_26890 [Halogranum salarium B-1]|uniref:Uncharacterized protein n=1 Tax=Halogranum salarium B-1 TaxID=1210908 RepID=J3A1S3_9EURY|nr:hypothetical protein HSB1_26890 [Halogranum salarium B-1]